MSFHSLPSVLIHVTNVLSLPHNSLSLSLPKQMHFIQISLSFDRNLMSLLLSKYMSLLMFFSFNYFWNQIPMIKHFHPGTMKKKGGITQEEQVML